MSEEVTVPLLDLKAQYAQIREEIEPILRRVAESQWFIFGPEVEGLETEIAAYSKTTHAIGCASGSDAILLALLAHGIGPGDEVICPSYTFFATGGYIVRAGATPVFCDIDPVTYNIDVESARAVAARCANLKAIMPVHLYGQMADMDAMMALGAELGVPVIEDAAQAIGSEDAQGRRAGSVASIGCFSFFPTKNLGGFGDGGITTTDDEELAHRMRLLRNHGMEPKYYHHMVGLNSRLDALQAAVLRVKLRYLDGWTAGRQANAAYYDRAFAEAGAQTTATPLNEGAFPLRTPAPAPAGARHIYNQYIIRVPASIRDELRAHLLQQRITTEMYYPLPLHRQKCFGHLGYSEGDLPESEAAARETIALPIYSELAEDQLAHVSQTIIAFVGNRSAVSA